MSTLLYLPRSFRFVKFKTSLRFLTCRINNMYSIFLNSHPFRPKINSPTGAQQVPAAKCVTYDKALAARAAASALSTVYELP